MKPFSLKTRLQWGWFKAAMIGTAIGLLIAPTVKDRLETPDKQISLSDLTARLYPGSRIKVKLNGQTVALAKSAAEAEAAYQAARLQYNRDGVRILHVELACEPADREKDADLLKQFQVLTEEELTKDLLTYFNDYADRDRQPAYTLRVNDYTVTLASMEDLVSVLEQTQEKYDPADTFQVTLKPPASENVTMYEVAVVKKETSSETEPETSPEAEPETSSEAEPETSSEAEPETPTENTGTSEAVTNTQNDTDQAVPPDDKNSNETDENAESGETSSNDNPAADGMSQLGELNAANVGQIGNANVEGSDQTGNSDTGSADPSGNSDTGNADTGSADSSGNADTDSADSSGNTNESSTEQSGNEEDAESADNPDADNANQAQSTPAEISSLPQAAKDGVQYVGFSDVIQVMATYASKSEIKDRDTAFGALTTPQQEESIYVIKPGDYLDLIAEKTHHTVDEIKELNPGIESDDDLYYDDRLHITIPQAAVQILVEKQETYRETYQEDVVYEDDENMFIGETEVVQEGKPGTHIVTDLVTYKDEQETGREQLEETVEVAAIAEIVKRGTKSQPTYMYPVTNWSITSNFGYRWGRLHAGVDVGVPIGTTVRASRAGQVVNAGWIGGYGNCVIIDHGDGISTRYGHLSEITVSVGDYVDQGQQVALSGNTGRSTGPHLHFEIRIGGEATDPMPYLEGTAN